MSNKEKLPKLVDVYRPSPSNPLCKRQLPLVVDENLTLVMDLKGSGIVCDNPLVRGTELHQFTKKWSKLSDQELRSSIQISKNQLLAVLNQNVPCVGCRRSVERLYYQLFKFGHPTLEPLMVTKDGIITIQEEKCSNPQILCSIFHDHALRLAKLIENQPKRNKKSLRCLLHSLDSQRSRPLTPVWRDVWECMKPDCKKEVCIIEAPTLHATLETYLRKHRFCGECRTKVLKAYTLLVEEPEPCKEKGYVSSLYAGIKRCLPDKHIHLQTKTDYITKLISRAEPELLGSRRERHAKTLEIAQEEVLTCLGICMYERLHRVYMRLREEECTCQVFAAVAVDTLSRSFETAVELKQGVSQLELLYEELAKEEQLKQIRREQKKIKRKRKKGVKNNNNNNNKSASSPSNVEKRNDDGDEEDEEEDDDDCKACGVVVNGNADDDEDVEDDGDEEEVAGGVNKRAGKGCEGCCGSGRNEEEEEEDDEEDEEEENGSVKCECEVQQQQQKQKGQLSANNRQDENFDCSKHRHNNRGIKMENGGNDGGGTAGAWLEDCKCGTASPGGAAANRKVPYQCDNNYNLSNGGGAIYHHHHHHHPTTVVTTTTTSGGGGGGGKKECGSSSDHSHDCGYSSENNGNGCCETGSLVSSLSSSPDGSESACSDACCQHETSTNGASSNAATTLTNDDNASSNASSSSVGGVDGNEQRRQHHHHAVVSHLRLTYGGDADRPSLQEMLEDNNSDEDDSNCFITAEEVNEFKNNNRQVYEKRKELRETLQSRFAQFCVNGPLTVPRLLVQTKYASN